MAGNSAWNKAVKIAFKMGRKTSKMYSLKQAMFDAKKIYKKGKNTVVNMGNQTRRRRKHRGGNATTTPKSMLSSLKMNGGEHTTTPKSLSSMTMNGGETEMQLPKMKGGKLTDLSPSNVTN
jgi:hypothetical protein